MKTCEDCGLVPAQTFKIVANVRQGKSTSAHLCYACADRPIVESKIEFIDVPGTIKQAILGHILDTKPPTREEEKAEVEAMIRQNEISEYNRAKYGE